MSDYISHEDMMSIPARELSDPSNIAAEPVVSVIMMTYNHEPYIAQAIEGVVMQQCNVPIELLIGEDCSTDRTRDICLEYQQRYPKLIRLVTSETNVGMHKNMFRLFGRAKGRYIAMCEGDDYWTDPEKLRKQVEFLEANKHFIICFHKVRILKNGELVEDYVTKAPPPVTNIRELSKGNYIHTCSSVFRNHVRQLPTWFNAKLNACDYPLHMILAERGKINYMPMFMAIYRVHSGGNFSGALPEETMRGNLFLLKVLLTKCPDMTVRVHLAIQLLSNAYHLCLLRTRNKLFSTKNIAKQA
jgi:glycosyltransferase involved in cell wall biosynthesis